MSQVPETTWDAERYEARYGFVWHGGAALLDLLAPQPGERILDLGCGTGHLTAEIAARGADVLGIDRSPEMIAQARVNHPGVRFEVGDGATFRWPHPFDALFSNAALHWMHPPDAVAATLGQALRPGGRLVLEMGGRGNIATILGALRVALDEAGRGDRGLTHPWYFPSLGDYASLLEANSLAVTAASLFDRPTPLDGGEGGLRDWLAMFAGSFFAGLPPETQAPIIRRVEALTRPSLFHDGRWVADYRRLRLMAVKE